MKYEADMIYAQCYAQQLHATGMTMTIGPDPVVTPRCSE